MPDLTQTQTESASPTADTGRRWRQFAQAALALSTAIAISWVLYANQDAIEEFAIYGYPSIFFISVLGNATIIFPAPVFALAFTVGGILNPVLVGIAVGCGAAIGEMTGYLAGFGGRGILEDKEIYRKLTALMTRWGAWIIFLLALIPNPVFDAGGIIAGALRMPWWKFLSAAAVGKSIRFIILALIGASVLG